jgi:hypothetical protein
MKLPCIATTLTLVGILLSLVAQTAYAQPSSEKNHPTMIATDGTYSNYLVTTDRPVANLYYLSFLAGPGKITIDTIISSRNRQAFFNWSLADTNAQTIGNKKSGCHGRLNNGVTRKQVICNFGASTTPRPVVLVIDNYFQGKPLLINYKIRISGDWKPLSSQATRANRRFLKPDNRV